MERKISKQGYVFIKPGKFWVSEHRYIMEQHIGRKLIKNVELVHHINHVKHDNRLENLELVTSSEHAKIHAIDRAKKYPRVCTTCFKTFKLGEYKHSHGQDGFKTVGLTAREIMSRPPLTSESTD